MSTPPAARPHSLNLTDHLLLPHLEAGHGTRPYMHCEGETLSYQRLHEDANRWGRVLQALGVYREQRVMMLMLESLHFPKVFWGSMRIGAIPVPLNTMLAAKDYRYYLEDSRARVLVVEHALWHLVEPWLAELPCLEHVILCGGEVEGYPRLETLIEQAPATLDTASLSPDEVALWLYTSGSTGTPKAVVHLLRSVLGVAEQMPAHLGLRPSDVGFSAAKMFFAYGLGNSLIFPMKTGGASVVQPERPSPQKVFEVLMRYRPSVFYAVPTLFNGMLHLDAAWRAGQDNPPAPLSNLDHLRFSVSAGESLPASLFDRWQERFGSVIVDGIGSTEMLHMFISNTPQEARSGCTGRVLNGYQARIVGENGQDLPPNAIGALWIQGESTAAHYWNKSAKTKATMHGPWMITGDKFHRDEAGWYFYHGRDDDMMKISGSWVSPLEVENALLSHDAVLECAVVGHNDAAGLMKPRAFVILQAGHAPSETLIAQLQQHVRVRLNGIKVPRWIEFVPSLPKTATGKIRRFQLRQTETSETETGETNPRQTAAHKTEPGTEPNTEPGKAEAHAAGS